MPRRDKFRLKWLVAKNTPWFKKRYDFRQLNLDIARDVKALLEKLDAWEMANK